MFFYLSNIITNTVCISLLAWLIHGGTFWSKLLLTILAVAVELVINAISALFVAKVLPKKCFNNDIAFYKVKKGEVKFYEFVKIKKWKDKIWELGKTNGFSKSKVENPRDVAYIARFIEESNIGILDHFISMLTGFLVVFCLPVKFWLTIGCPVAFTSLFLNLWPIMVLRYNKFKLEKIYDRLKVLQPKIEDTVVEKNEKMEDATVEKYENMEDKVVEKNENKGVEYESNRLD